MFARRLVTAQQAVLLEERAFRMRCSPTRSEEWLWSRLSGSKTGFAFRRQLVIGPTIVDFACTKARFVVEVDGSSHKGRLRHDAERDRRLNQLGWRVLRIEDARVFQNIDAVVREIVGARLAVTTRDLDMPTHSCWRKPRERTKWPPLRQWVVVRSPFRPIGSLLRRHGHEITAT